MNYEQTLRTWFDNSVLSVSSQKYNYEEINRYKKKFLIEVNEPKNVQLSFFRKSDMTLDIQDSDSFFYIDAKYAYRPDLISYNIYGSPLYYWAILAANNMKSFWDMEPGLTIRIPDLISILGE